MIRFNNINDYYFGEYLIILGRKVPLWFIIDNLRELLKCNYKAFINYIYTRYHHEFKIYTGVDYDLFKGDSLSTYLLDINLLSPEDIKNSIYQFLRDYHTQISLDTSIPSYMSEFILHLCNMLGNEYPDIGDDIIKSIDDESVMYYQTHPVEIIDNYYDTYKRTIVDYDDTE